MIDLADAEAAFLGNIVRACVHRGTIPPVSLRPLWFTNRGKCVGLRIIGHDDDEFDLDGNHSGGDYLEPLRPIVQHLKAYAGEVVETPGVDWMLYEWGTIRDIYYEMYPVEDDEWVTMDKAEKVTGRKKTQIYAWAAQMWVRRLKCEGLPTLYCKEDLMRLTAGIPMGRPRKSGMA